MHHRKSRCIQTRCNLFDLVMLSLKSVPFSVTLHLPAIMSPVFQGLFRHSGSKCGPNEFSYRVYNCYSASTGMGVTIPLRYFYKLYFGTIRRGKLKLTYKPQDGVGRTGSRESLHPDRRSHAVAIAALQGEGKISTPGISAALSVSSRPC
jgi:hypothetical protein